MLSFKTTFGFTKKSPFLTSVNYCRNRILSRSIKRNLVSSSFFYSSESHKSPFLLAREKSRFPKDHIDLEEGSKE